MIIFAAILLVLTSTPIEEYFYSFTELPPGWEADSEWEFDTSGAHASIGAWSTSGSTNSNSGTISSGTDFLVMPENAVTVNVTMSHAYEFSGGTYPPGGSSMASTSLGVSKNGSESYFLLYEHSFYGLKDGREYSSPMMISSVDIPVTEGDELSFQFIGTAFAQHAWAIVELDIFTMLVSVYDGTNLDRYSWGVIKTAF